jgi:hypothetical protein
LAAASESVVDVPPKLSARVRVLSTGNARKKDDGLDALATAMDRRVKTVALVAGGYNITDTYLGFLGAEGFRDYLDNLNSSRQRQYESGEIEYMPAVAGPPNYAPSSMPVQEAYE